MTYQEENNGLAESFFDHTFGKGWKTPNLKECENFRSLEIFLNDKCNLACKYCYLQRYGGGLYPQELQEPKDLLKNLELFLNWMEEKDYVPAHIELFSGEVFIQDVAWKAMEMILERFKGKERKPDCLVVPTNFTFMLSNEITARVEDILQRSRDIGLPIGLSASFDGKYCEANRPFRSGKEIRDDDYYDKTFEFAKKWGTGFHPMIYSEHVEDWERNWLWFQDNFTKHKLPWKNIYLLEVRNTEWTNKQIKKLGEFMEFLIDWTFHGPCKGDVDAYVRFLFDGGYNILRNPLTTIGRGIGCSIQSAVALRLGDLSWVPCHRTSYSPFNFGNFRVENDKITGFNAKNVDMLTTIYSFDASTQPWCEQCLMKPLCSFGCLGSQLETVGDPFTPIPSVCELEHVKVMSMIRAYRRLNILDPILVKINQTKADAIIQLEKMLTDGK
jgi:radical SAM protein with 4Fe4S-binding SPASM domain